jgi:hypothetical protein
MVPAPFAYGALIERIAPAENCLLIDIGHLRTNVALISQGRTLAGRTLSFGGHHLTEALRVAFHLSYNEAESLKISQGRLPDAERGVSGSDKIASLLQVAIEPLGYALRQMADGLESRTGVSPSRVFLCGGSSRLQHIDAYVATLLGIPVQPLGLSEHADFANAGFSPEAEALGTLAVGTAFEQGRRQTLNLRQGRLALKTTQSVFRDKLVPLVASIILMLTFAAGGATSTIYALRREESELKKQLSSATKRVFGEAVSNPQTVLRRLRDVTKGEGSAVPEMTAVDILVLLSSSFPSAEEAKLDLSRLEIKSGKTDVAGMADSQRAVGQIVEKLRGAECISEVSTGKVTEVADGKKQFSLSLKTNCF